MTLAPSPSTGDGAIRDKSRLTPRAPDGWDSSRFQAGFLARAGSGKTVFSRPARLQVTHAVGQPLLRQRLEFIGGGCCCFAS